MKTFYEYLREVRVLDFGQDNAPDNRPPPDWKIHAQKQNPVSAPPSSTQKPNSQNASQQVQQFWQTLQNELQYDHNLKGKYEAKAQIKPNGEVSIIINYKGGYTPQSQSFDINDVQNAANWLKQISNQSASPSPQQYATAGGYGAQSDQHGNINFQSGR